MDVAGDAVGRGPHVVEGDRQPAHDAASASRLGSRSRGAPATPQIRSASSVIASIAAVDPREEGLVALPLGPAADGSPKTTAQRENGIGTR